MTPGNVVTQARELWRGRLIDVTRNNQLLYYRPLKVGTIELATGSEEAIARLLGGADVLLSRLCQGIDEAAALTVERRFAEICRKAMENEEERGLRTLHLALWMATWPADDGQRPFTAPVVLLPVERSGDRVRPSVRRAGDPDANLALVHVLETAHGCAGLGDALEDIDPNDDPPGYPAAVVAALRGAVGHVAGFAVAERAVLSNFSFQKLAMVRDLDALAPEMQGNLVVAAMAGDLGAAAHLQGLRDPIDVASIDRQSPDSEFSVLPADSSQQVVIAQVVRGDNGVIIGPPGTGKSQTISNLIAELAARGKSVLFVAEKRAALDAVKKRLVAADLGHLLLDLHGTVTKKEIMRQFGEAIAGVAEATPVDTAALHGTFERARTRLNEHSARMHAPLPPTGLSLYQLQGRLVTAGPDAEAKVLWRGADFGRFTPHGIAAAEERLRELSAVADLFLGQSSSPWARARVRSSQEAQEAVELAERALARLVELGTLISTCVDELGLAQPATLGEADRVAAMAATLGRTVAAYGPEILSQDLTALAQALAPADRSWFARLGTRYRRARRQTLRLRRTKATATTLLTELRAAGEALVEWSHRAPGRAPVASSAADAVAAAIDELRGIMGAVRAAVDIPDPVALDAMALDAVHALLNTLAGDDDTPLRVARVHELTRDLSDLGVDKLLAALSAQQVPASQWLDALRRAIWVSTILAARAVDPGLAAFSGRVLDTVVAEFRQSDEDRTVMSAARVRRGHAAAAIATMNAQREQTALLTRQAALKTRHKALRQVMVEAPDVAVALKPCWMASPLSVSQLLGGGRSGFDVVIFDEASQVRPEEAVAALMRARSVVVAGDPHQLPPTAFFASRTIDDDDELEATAGDDATSFESVLDVLSSVLRPWDLEWHYRSKDERLIAFSNEYIYGRRLVTFPGPGLEAPVRHVLVARSGGDADEDSPLAEVEAVAQLVSAHAHRDAGEGRRRSLGVITMGVKHMRRVEARMDELRATDPVLDAFCGRRGDDAFFVKNLERVQGDERGTIILSIGYGTFQSGRLQHSFGPINNAGGERRLNVAITRASHEMILVSSFSHLDMAPERTRSQGARLLRAFVEYMAGHGQSLVHEGMTPFEENAFERDVADALRAAGVEVLPQYGVGRYRIDMVTRHPRREGLLALAVECDGATYHSSPTARDRDRLRQQHLEALGWRFCRIWSTDWFQHRAEEIRRVVEMHNRRVLELDGAPEGLSSAPDNIVPMRVTTPPSRRGTRPAIAPGMDITFYGPQELDSMLRWIRSDGLLRTDDQLVDEAMGDLGFRRRGPRIEAALRDAVERTRRSA